MVGEGGGGQNHAVAECWFILSPGRSSDHRSCSTHMSNVSGFVCAATPPLRLEAVNPGAIAVPLSVSLLSFHGESHLTSAGAT